MEEEKVIKKFTGDITAGKTTTEISEIADKLLIDACDNLQALYQLLRFLAKEDRKKIIEIDVAFIRVKVELENILNIIPE